MRDNHEVEWVGLADFNKRLESCQAERMVLKKLRELVPNEKNCGQVIFLNHALNPCRHVIHVNEQTILPVFLEDFHNSPHETFRRFI